MRVLFQLLVTVLTRFMEKYELDRRLARSRRLSDILNIAFCAYDNLALLVLDVN